MKNFLDLLFGSRERWRLIKFFILNEKGSFSQKEIIEKNKLNEAKAKKIIRQLIGAKFLINRKKNSVNFYHLNNHFVFLPELKNLVVKSNVFPQCESLGRIKKIGDVKFALVSGVFINYPKTKTDLLIVADMVSKTKLKHLIEDLEAEMGREINYSIMNFAEFKYRINLFDRFIIELLESPHEIIINKIASFLSNIQRRKNNVF